MLRKGSLLSEKIKIDKEKMRRMLKGNVVGPPKKLPKRSRTKSFASARRRKSNRERKRRRKRRRWLLKESNGNNSR